MFTLDSHQQSVCNQLVQQAYTSPGSGALCAAPMGSGKTLVAIEFLKQVAHDTVVIIGPNNVYYDWADKLESQWPEAPSKLKRLDSTKSGKAAYQDLKESKPGFYYLTRERVRYNERSKFNIDWSKLIADVVIWDEVHFIASGRKSQAWKAATKMLPERVSFRLGLSGTPFGSFFPGAWGVTKWIFPEAVPNSKNLWGKQWCNWEYNPFSQFAQMTTERTPGAFVKSLPCYVTLPAPDVPVLPTQVRYVDLTATQRKLYNSLQEDMVVFLEENPLVVEIPLTLRIRLRQITLAVPSIDEEHTYADGKPKLMFKEDAPSSKLKELKEIIKDLEPERKYLILTDSTSFAHRVAKELGDKAVAWTGRISSTVRNEQYKKSFIEGDTQFIVANIDAIAEGVDGLQSVCNTVVWLSHSEKRIKNEQAFKRIARRGQTKPVLEIDIQARDTYDSGQLSKQLEDELNMRKSLTNAS